jgi:formylglycine-generating enzyme required for sulfatase activity
MGLLRILGMATFALLPYGTLRMAQRFVQVGMVLSAIESKANDLQVSTSMLVDPDPTDGLAFVQFDIGWQNSWRVSTAPNNWDAAWVFVKFRAGATDPVLAGASSAGTTITLPSTALLRTGMPVILLAGTGMLAPATVITGITSATTITVNLVPVVALSGATLRFDRIWEHAHLGNTASHIAPANTTITVGCADAVSAYSAANPGVGVFIHRSVDGTGSFSAPGCQLQWLQGAQGITIGTTLELCVHAVEMVLVPTGNYYLGGAGSYAFRNGSSGTTPRLITSENHLPYADAFTVTLSYGGPGLGNDFGSAFPKGYEAFYCMKYELSQGEYVAYLNKLTRVQQALMVATNVVPGLTSVFNRYVMSNSPVLVNRSGIRCPATIDPTMAITFMCDADGDGTADEADDGAWIAANYVNAPNALAYLDWSGLRPMSEMEFEKACRGPGLPVANDVPTGGNTSSVIAPTFQVGLNTVTENVDAVANGSYGAASLNDGPFRCGVFAEAGATRASAGASYYGVMDLGGNVAEYTVSAAYLSLIFQRRFHGNGMLTFIGTHDGLTWPVDGFTGYAPRGGSWLSIVQYQSVSDRVTMFPFNATRFHDRGFRGVRRAP